jgi:beta-lactamase class A
MHINRRNGLWFLGGSLLFGKNALAQEPPTAATMTRAEFVAHFRAAMSQIEAAAGGRLGVGLIWKPANSASHIYEYNGMQKFPMCSTFKLLLAGFILQMVDENKLSLTQNIVIRPTDIVAYSPVIQEKSGLTMSIYELCAAIMTRSDNGAANILIGLLGGIDEFNHRLRMLWDHQTHLDRLEPHLNSAAANDLRDTTAPAQMATNLRQFLMPRANRSVLTPELQEMFKNWLINNQTGGESIRKGLPSNWVVGDKTGAGENNTVNDVAVIYLPNGDIIYVAAYLTQARDEFPVNKKYLADVGRFIAGNFV